MRNKRKSCASFQNNDYNIRNVVPAKTEKKRMLKYGSKMRSYLSRFLCFNQKLEELTKALKKGRGMQTVEKSREVQKIINKCIKE